MIDGLASLGAELRPCTCSVCALHHLAHPQQTAALLGVPARVDTALAPLLWALADSGVLTVASCADMAEAVDRIQPTLLPRILARRGQPGLHYGDVAARRWAFVRVVDTPTGGRFLDAAQRAGGEVTRGGMVAQAAFPPDRLDDLERVL